MLWLTSIGYNHFFFHAIPTSFSLSLMQCPCTLAFQFVELDIIFIFGSKESFPQQLMLLWNCIMRKCQIPTRDWHPRHKPSLRKLWSRSRRTTWQLSPSFFLFVIQPLVLNSYVKFIFIMIWILTLKC